MEPEKWSQPLTSIIESHAPLFGRNSRAFLPPRQSLVEAVLANSFIFLHKEERDFILEQSEYVTLSDNEVLLAEGFHNQSMYIVTEGEFRVEQAKGPVGGTFYRLELARLRPGAVFGEMSFLNKDGASATISAVGESEVLHVKSSVITALIDTIVGFDGRFYKSLAVMLSRRSIGAGSLQS